MRIHRYVHGRRIACVFLLALGTGVIPTGTAAASSEPTVEQRLPSGPPSLTLITGDHLRLDGDGRLASFEPAADRESMAYSISRLDGHEYVIPLDAAPLVATGKLDRRLFDVRELLDLGYDDTSRNTLPLVVTYSPGVPHVLTAQKAGLPAFWRQLAGGATSPTALTGGLDTISLADPDGSPKGDLPTPKAAEETQSYALTLRYRDQEGEPTSRFATNVHSIAGDQVPRVPGADGTGTVTVRLPKGDYVLDNELTSTRADGVVEYVSLPYPNLTLSADTEVDVDARQAKPITIVPPDHPAQGYVLFWYQRPVRDTVWEFAYSGVNVGRSVLLTAHLGPALPGLVSMIDADFGPPVLDPPAAEPTFYRLAWLHRDTVPAGFTRTVRKRDLAKVRLGFGPAPAGRTGAMATFAHVPGTPGLGGIAVGHPVTLPGKATEYRTPGVDWLPQMYQFDAIRYIEVEQIAPKRTYLAGREYDERYNFATIGPSLPKTESMSWVSRRGDTITAIVPLFGDSAGHEGLAAAATRIALYRNDQLIGESGDNWSRRGAVFTVPPDDARYRLVAEATRSGSADVTTALSAAWTFRSGHVDGPRLDLPVSVIRFNPELDSDNAAPAGRSYLVPVTMQTQAATMLGHTPRIDVDVSYDDGQTWTKALVIGHTAHVRHPATANFVSLRAKTTDSDDNSVEETVIHAYKLTHGS